MWQIDDCDDEVPARLFHAPVDKAPVIETCIHCKVAENTHHLLTRTCRHCGRPRAREIFLFGVLNCDYDPYDVFVGPMAMYHNAVSIGGLKLELGGRPVYIDSKRLLYQMKD